MWVGGFLLVIVILSGYLMFNYGIKLIGVSIAVIIGVINFSLIVILVWLII